MENVSVPVEENDFELIKRYCAYQGWREDSAGVRNFIREQLLVFLSTQLTSKIKTELKLEN